MHQPIVLSLDEDGIAELPGLGRYLRKKPVLSPPQLRSDVREVAQREWEDRAGAEYVGVMIVRRFHGLLVDLNAPLDLQELALIMLVQEQQHTALCMAAARSLGSDGRVALPLAQLQQARTQEPVDVQLLKMLATTFMVGEVTALGLLTHGIRSLPPSGYTATLREIARDEALHARIGPMLLRRLRDNPESTWAKFPGREAIQAWVAQAQADLRVRDVVESATLDLFEDPEAAQQLSAVGIPDPRQFKAAYREAIRTNVPRAVARVFDDDAVTTLD
ncbi:MAG: hypothetical protein KC502_03995 [Myxococcales bacterium]|nr:hypothetical protein [Myxococcales bacterium]